MATSKPVIPSVPQLLLINATDKQKLELVRRNITTVVEDEVVIADMYRDPQNLAVAILVVNRHMPLENLELVLADPAARPKAQSGNGNGNITAAKL